MPCRAAECASQCLIRLVAGLTTRSLHFYAHTGFFGILKGSGQCCIQVSFGTRLDWGAAILSCTRVLRPRCTRTSQTYRKNQAAVPLHGCLCPALAWPAPACSVLPSCPCPEPPNRQERSILLELLAGFLQTQEALSPAIFLPRAPLPCPCRARAAALPLPCPCPADAARDFWISRSHARTIG